MIKRWDLPFALSVLLTTSCLSVPTPTPASSLSLTPLASSTSIPPPVIQTAESRRAIEQATALARLQGPLSSTDSATAFAILGRRSASADATGVAIAADIQRVEALYARRQTAASSTALPPAEATAAARRHAAALDALASLTEAMYPLDYAMNGRCVESSCAVPLLRESAKRVDALRMPSNAQPQHSALRIEVHKVADLVALPASVTSVTAIHVDEQFKRVAQARQALIRVLEEN